MNTTQTATVNETAKVNVTQTVASHTVKSCKITLVGTLVSFDAKLQSAAREEVNGLKMVVKTEDGKIVPVNQIYTAEGKYYNYPDVGRALDNGDGTFLWIEKAEIEACKSSDNDKEIKITKFVPMAEVDAVFFDNRYFVAADPNVKKGKPVDPNCTASLYYATLMQTMKEVGLVALAKVDFKGKEHNCIIRVYNDNGKDVLMLHTVYTSNDVRTSNVLRPTAPVSDALLSACKAVVATMTESFDRHSLTSTSDAKFNALVDGKRAAQAGQATPTAGTPTASTADDALLAALTGSLKLATAKKETPAVVEETVVA